MTRLQGLICLVAAALMLVEVAVLETRLAFLVAGLATAAVTLALVRWMTRQHGEGRAALVYAVGLLGAVGGYCYLALAPSGAISPQDEVIDWGRMDKRPLIFGYLGIAAFIAFHWLWVAFVQGPRSLAHPSVVVTAQRWPARLLGALGIALLTYCWLGLPALLGGGVGGGEGLAKFYDLHAHVHLSALQQIRLGAIPYLEAQTQYGPGNQLLLGALTDFVHFSNHGFLAANLLLNAVCIIVFFVAVQQFLGFGWAVAGLVGWVLWPSPVERIDLAGWAVLTRWLVVPILALWLAWLLLGAGAGWRGWRTVVLAGMLWGAGGFLSQENLSGGLLVLIFSLALFAPASGRSPKRLAHFAGLFLLAGAMTFAALVSFFMGPSHLIEVVALANAKSSLVMAGVSNSIWSDNLGLKLGWNIVDGRLETDLAASGEFRELILTYALVALFLISLSLLAAFLGRRWKTADEPARAFCARFAGVAVGAFVLHVFSLLRSDTSHLAGPSFLLGLFLLMLPVFVWRCLAPGKARAVLLVVSLAVIAEGVISGAGEVERRVAGLGGVWHDSAAVLDLYDELRSHRSDVSDLAGLYSPLPRVQAVFRNHPDFAEAEEFFVLLRDRLEGRPVELGSYRFDDLVAHPDTAYFLGGLRSLSGITSPKNSLWLRSEQEAWIAKVASTRSGCLFFNADSNRELVDAWMRSVKPPQAMVIEPIAGRREYGILACKSGARS
ncbi:hypothetical protein [Reyranella sp.]|jgi:hypothetical protein|uniref:hypothetical protein n=1 Tax=Reyranella sp. TaxID=1929291 RepID=UPI000BC98754|nr:hypothetical protein [Reyranella sp.]OYY46030.1 MAG: hypothetical protein B7Y57_04035 [Rhodospirillales bacterium 35-66-84]OYZ96410.1 MAG: hypothetical protein B7Y08_04395 [Rhodospirillales bacterium 24-66-33]OZB28426.1 MAG: hypothetical protein B7X63_00745 [Rhodospirillales bacterium 39-66-50]HQS14365.1 hypothetical protein [Reyranella sp.]HQT11361.1 hypothetical protein [Reyranella sp.]